MRRNKLKLLKMINKKLQRIKNRTTLKKANKDMEKLSNMLAVASRIEVKTSELVRVVKTKHYRTKRICNKMFGTKFELYVTAPENAYHHGLMGVQTIKVYTRK